MHETDLDLKELQQLLDRSYQTAGAHLLSIHTPDRRLNARGVADRLGAICLLALATVTADNRPIVGPVDGIFYRGNFYFGSAPHSLRLRHLAKRPQLSATHLPGEHLAVTVHGHAEPVDLAAERTAGLRETLLATYVPRYGPQWERFMERARYTRVAAERMFAFSTPT
jgi:nitroimidazol reductase NimA-like FMN-containing flavoprotein (pyridoxamine 5'-phosphate oxidase superfamily)